MRVYILLTDTGSVLTKAIKLYTRKPYNHVSISFHKELDVTYSFGRLRPRNPFIGGFVQEQLDNGVFKNARCAVYSCQISEKQYEKMMERIKEMESQKELYHFNLIGMLGIAAKLEIKRDKAFFCSQFVATVLQDGEVELDSKPIYWITPYDISKCPQLRLEYQGYLRNYRQLNESNYA